MTTIEIHRMREGPTLVIDAAEELAFDFFVNDPSSKAGGYDDLAGAGDPDHITTDDIVAINRTMRARSPHAVWEAVTAAEATMGWLVAIDQSWDLVALEEETWETKARPAIQSALEIMVATGRGLSVATKLLHLKRPRMFPVLDSLVLQQLGVTDSVSAIDVVKHLRSEGGRNLEGLLDIQAVIAPRYRRSLVRIMDVLLWASHPAAGLAPLLGSWQHVMRRA